MHQVGNTGDRLALDGQRGDQRDVGLRRRRHRDRHRVVDVVGEPCRDTAGRGTAKGISDDRRCLGTEVEVVLRDVEGVLGGVEELGDRVCDLRRLLPAVRQSADLDAIAH